MALIDKLEAIKIRWKDLEQQLSDPGVVADMKKFKQISKEYKDIEPVVDVYEKYKDLQSNLSFNKKLLRSEKDAEMLEMIKLEIEEGEEKIEALEEELRLLMVPKDPEDDKDCILEIRAGTGGDEAGIFVGDLFRMYQKYCESMGWAMEIINANESSSGGFKEIAMEVSGDGVYGVLKYESGVHRVQRVPKTESQGRVHTSAATVAVLPEAEEVDVDINPADLRIDTFRASGAGGQHVNKTESAIRITHIPTGTVAECQDGRSQHKNKDMAMKMLRTRIYEKALKTHNDAIASKRKTMVSSGDRSAKIRTYNWPQGRVTDHRINLTLYNLDAIIGGDIQHIIDELIMAENAEKMKEGVGF
ncbi:MAG: peptide chain release factor 1 [Chitinophagales bacterium]